MIKPYFNNSARPGLTVGPAGCPYGGSVHSDSQLRGTVYCARHMASGAGARQRLTRSSPHQRRARSVLTGVGGPVQHGSIHTSIQLYMDSYVEIKPGAWGLGPNETPRTSSAICSECSSPTLGIKVRAQLPSVTGLLCVTSGPAKVTASRLAQREPPLMPTTAPPNNRVTQWPTSGLSLWGAGSVYTRGQPQPGRADRISVSGSVNGWKARAERGKNHTWTARGSGQRGAPGLGPLV